MAKKNSSNEKKSNVVKKKAIKKKTAPLKPIRKVLAKKESKSIKKAGTVGASAVIEMKSRAALKIALSPWICTGTGGEGIDHGHDFYVEIVNEADFNTFDADGRHFLMQLKAQSKLPRKGGVVIPKSVKTEKIKQWYQNSHQLPYLFVVNDYPTNKFYFHWIDGAFITNLEKEHPHWTTEEYITFKIPVENLISEQSMNTIRDHVRNKKVQFGKLIEPGIYFNLKKKIEDLIIKYELVVQPLQFNSIENSIADFKQKAENATYRLAITGLSRVGKSTLVNTVLKRKGASPTDINQTTGVPIQFHPSQKESVTVYYLDERKPESFEYSEETIKQFAARDYNEDNHKKVSFVLAHIASSQLEKGVMLYDIPGLNDPNPQILNYAYHTANCANVIVYVIDGSSADSGGFVFDDRYRTHIENFSSKDKIFLVVNKVDKLKKDRLLNLKKEIGRNLDKYNLREKVNEKIYFLSIDPEEDDCENLKQLVGEYHPFEELENDLWQFILNGDRVGLFKLYILLKEFNKSLTELDEILHVTHLNSNSKKQLDEAIKSTREKIPRLNEYIRNQHSQILKNIKINIDARKESAIKNLETSLRNISLKNNLPSDNAIKDWAIKEYYRIMGLTEKDFVLEINHLKQYIDNWMKDNLKAVKEILRKENPSFEYDVNTFEGISMPKIDFSSAWGAAFIGLLVGALFGPEIALLLAAGGALITLIMGQEFRRDKKIRGTVKQIDKVYSKFFADVKFRMDSIVRDELRKIENEVNQKLNSYFADITNEINKLNLPSNIDYLSILDNTKESIKAIKKEHADLVTEVHPYLASIQLT